MGSKSRLLQVLTGKNGVNSVPTQGLKWRRGWDSNPRKDFTSLNGLANRRLQPLGHPSTRNYPNPGTSRPVLRGGGIAVKPRSAALS